MQKWKYGRRLDRFETDLSNSCSREALILLNERDIRLQDFYSSIRGEFFSRRPAWGTHQRPPARPFWVSGKNNNLSFGIASLPRALTISLVPKNGFLSHSSSLQTFYPKSNLCIRRSERELPGQNLIPDSAVNPPSCSNAFVMCNISLRCLLIHI